MPHLRRYDFHKYVGDALVLVIPVRNLAQADTTTAAWRVRGTRGVVKTVGDGVALIDVATAKVTYAGEGVDFTGFDDMDVVLVVSVDAAEIEADVGIGQWYWQAAAGGLTPQVVSHGTFTVSRRIPDPVGT